MRQSTGDAIGAAVGRLEPATAVLEKVMLAFEGLEVSPELRRRLAAPTAGVTLFRPFNIRDPGQLRELTESLRRAAGRTLLVAADHEGGQLISVGDAFTPFAGNMALGATCDADLVERVAATMGTELRAAGINVDYAPVCDLSVGGASQAIGIRSFGDDPASVGELAAAFVRGLQSTGVAATAKHFPGLGAATADSHHGLAVVDGDRAWFDGHELVPFRAAIDAGVRLVMSGHVATPGLTGKADLPATLSRQAMHGLLREELGFDGLTITDALDMAAIGQGEVQIVDVIAAVRAGVDLLLTMEDPDARARLEAGLRQAVGRELFDEALLRATAARLENLRSWIESFDAPDPSVIGSEVHLRLAREVAARSITLVRDDPGLLPIAPAPETPILAVMPTPADLTPADTSSYVEPGLAAALRPRHPSVREIVTGHPPLRSDIAAVREQAADAGLVVIGTIAATPGSPQAELVEAVQDAGVPVIAVALRTPFDLLAYPRVGTYVCTYGLLEPSLEALADTLFGRAPFAGRLPAAIDGIAPTGHGIVGT
jgi:beta-N-acetylhexosaminidase